MSNRQAERQFRGGLPSPSSDQLSADFVASLQALCIFPICNLSCAKVPVRLEAIERSETNRNVELTANEAVYSESQVTRRRESVRRETFFHLG